MWWSVESAVVVSRGVVGVGGLKLRRVVWCEWVWICGVIGGIEVSRTSASARRSFGCRGLGDCHDLCSDPCRLVHIPFVRSDREVVFPEYCVSVESR